MAAKQGFFPAGFQNEGRHGLILLQITSQTYNGIMVARLRIRSWLLPLTVIGIMAMEIIHPSAVWRGLLTALGGALLISYLWARSLQRGLRLERAMRFGWMQVGDALEEEFVL